MKVTNSKEMFRTEVEDERQSAVDIVLFRSLHECSCGSIAKSCHALCRSVVVADWFLVFSVCDVLGFCFGVAEPDRRFMTSDLFRR